MNPKTKRIIATILIILPALMLLASAFGKFAAAQPVVDGLTKAGFIPYFPLTALAIVELVATILLLIPKTYKIGFLLVTAYLGGAASIEIAGHSAPVALALLTVLWIGVYLRDKNMFLNTPASNATPVKKA